ncbi:MAG: Nicotinamide-nucleotide amidohydrolase PncC [Paracidovorax wautersii]|uniref:Nicotinamide-nucleotide amidohydrolase PncC n=1 Tax=Paracidovorax wautersii TaxID=1177982 RepID=A0A7V8FND8_9BURK|nr:MAG: Nicotinamide-nucleotide amidohydrolase PncC [Paracidovorax wautersii]
MNLDDCNPPVLPDGRPASGADLAELAVLLCDQLLARRWMLTTAESCTGGLIAAACTELAGSSRWFERGFVTYSNAAKAELLGVPYELLEAHGAVSEPVVREMAAGAVRRSQAQVGVSVSGVAGPDGGSPNKPVGTVCFGYAVGRRVMAETCHFAGDRQAVRRASVAHALGRLIELVAARPL